MENATKKNSVTIKQIVDTAILIALAIVLKFISDLIPFLNYFEGGTIDLAMLPILLIGFRNGPKYGFIGATLYWLLAWAIGGFKIYSQMVFLEILLDRFVPYSIGYGIAGLFYKKRDNRLSISLVIVLCALIRLLSHTISGVIIWYTWTGYGEFMTSLWASFIYNVSYVGLTCALALILFNSLKTVLYYKAPLSIQKKDIQLEY